jgi:hypothetical protein
VKLASSASPFVVYSTGTSLGRDRELAGWDVRNLTQCLFRQRVDDGIGALVPLVDQDTGLLCLYSKGDMNVRVFEPSSSSASMLHGVNRFVTCSKPCKSMAMLPKVRIPRAYIHTYIHTTYLCTYIPPHSSIVSYANNYFHVSTNCVTNAGGM